VIPFVDVVGSGARAAPEQIAATAAKVGVTLGLTFIVTVDVAAGHAPAGSFVVSVKITEPVIIVGVYVDVNEAAFEKVPLGAVQVEVVALPPMVPANVIVPPAQTV
jgi:hypothetical protein